MVMCLTELDTTQLCDICEMQVQMFGQRQIVSVFVHRNCNENVRAALDWQALVLCVNMEQVSVKRQRHNYTTTVLPTFMVQ